MTISDELSRLHELHQRGGLSDEEFARAKAKLIDALPHEPAARSIAAVNAWRRSRQDAWIGGVCGGIARSTGLESWLVRLLFSLLLFCGGAGLVIYLLIWIFVPAE